MHDFNDFLSAKFHEIWTQQRRPVLRWKLSEQNFANFTVRIVFFSKNRKNFSQNFNVLGLQADITTQWLQIARNSLPNNSSTECLISIIRSSLLSRRNKVGLKCPSVRPYTKSFFDFNNISTVCRGLWVMHDGMQYDPIQGHCHEPLKVGNPSIFKSCLLRHLQWELATDHWFLNYGTISKFDRARFWYLSYFLSRDVELGRDVSCEESTVSPVRD